MTFDAKKYNDINLLSNTIVSLNRMLSSLNKEIDTLDSYRFKAKERGASEQRIKYFELKIDEMDVMISEYEIMLSNLKRKMTSIVTQYNRGCE